MAPLPLSLGRGCDASSCSLSDNRSVRASWAGPNTVVRSFALLRFLTVERRPFAMVDGRERMSKTVEADGGLR